MREHERTGSLICVFRLWPEKLSTCRLVVITDATQEMRWWWCLKGICDNTYRGCERRLEGCHGISRRAMLLRVMFCVGCVFPTPVTYSVARHDLEERLQRSPHCFRTSPRNTASEAATGQCVVCMETLTSGETPVSDIDGHEGPDIILHWTVVWCKTTLLGRSTRYSRGRPKNSRTDQGVASVPQSGRAPQVQCHMPLHVD